MRYRLDEVRIKLDGRGSKMVKRLVGSGKPLG